MAKASRTRGAPKSLTNSGRYRKKMAVGSNAEVRWMEGDPNLVTAYALLTLANCK